MSGWMVCLIILAVLILLAMVRVGGAAEFSAGGLIVWGRAGCFRWKVYPRKKREEKEPRKARKAKQEKEGGGPQHKPGGARETLRRFLPLIGEAAGELKRRIRIDTLHLDFVAAAPDAAMAAMAFGGANAAVGMIWPIFEQNFDIRDHRIRTAVDFQAGKPTVYLYAAFSGRIGQFVSFGARDAVKCLRIYQSGKRPANTQKEAI